ncbi:MAG: CHAD domain-containing protein [Aquabacterium sp.]|nr:CHAD domain-containing protein [Aquabacterium sp.]
MAQDPHGREAGLIELYGTDITRTRALVTVGAGTLFEGVVELALDLGQIHAGPLSVPVRELEIESVSGHPMAVILAGRDWVARHGLWLDTQTKAHRGDRLAREAAASPASATTTPDETEAAVHATLARPAKVKPGSTMDEAWRAGLETCLEHITGNLSELGNAPAATAALAYQLRLGLRRLRALGRLWAHTPWALPAGSLDKATTLTRQLGYWRDQEALAWLPERLRAAGGPALPLPCPAQTRNQPANVVALARSALATELCLDLLAALLVPERPADVPHTELLPWLNARLTRWSARCARHAHGLAKLSDTELHQLRKRGKRLRLAAAIYAPLWSDKAFRRHDRALKNALTALGHVQDEVVAHAWYAQLAQQDAQAAFACEWLQSRRKSLRKKAHRSWQRWLKHTSPW